VFEIGEEGEEKVMVKTKQKKRGLAVSTERPSRKIPKRAAACKDLKEKSFSISDKSCLIETKKDQTVEEEIVAVRLTAGQDDGRPNRRIAEFILHDAEGKAHPLEMLEVIDLYITGVILPLEASTGKKKEKGIKCETFGRIESWDISGYEEGYPVIWISTDLADYDCQKPAASYRKFYDLFFEKARPCIEVYKKVTVSSGGDPNISLDELLAGMVRSMSGSKSFSGTASIKDFVISQGEFIYKKLIGLDMTSKTNHKMFADMSALIALRDEAKKHANHKHTQLMPSSGSLRIISETGDGDNNDQMDAVDSATGVDGDAKFAQLLQEQEYWQSIKQQKSYSSVSVPSKYYIKINEDEIANDYPLPAFYKTTVQETDEFIVFDNDYCTYDPDRLPQSMLHNWSLYNSDARLVSLELLPMKPCSDIDVTIFGSGVMTPDDGSGFNLETEAGQSSSSSSEVQAVDGIPIYLSAIKEWGIEFGASMVFVTIRTDVAWYDASCLKLTLLFMFQMKFYWKIHDYLCTKLSIQSLVTKLSQKNCLDELVISCEINICHYCM